MRVFARIGRDEQQAIARTLRGRAAVGEAKRARALDVDREDRCILAAQHKMPGNRRDGNRRSCKTLRTQRVIDQRLNLSCQQIQIRPIAGVAGAEENHLVCTAQGDGAAIGACDQQTECEICREFAIGGSRTGGSHGHRAHRCLVWGEAQQMQRIRRATQGQAEDGGIVHRQAEAIARQVLPDMHRAARKSVGDHRLIDQHVRIGSQVGGA